MSRGEQAPSSSALERSSVRVSTQPAALSSALDPAQQSPQAAVSALQQAVPAGKRLAIMKLIAARPAHR